MSDQTANSGRQALPPSPYQIQVSYGAFGGIARGTGADWFGPLDPLKPIAPADVAGRRFDFPPGYNLVTQPRAYEPIGFHELRAFADAYDLLRLVIETRKDQMERQRWRIRLRQSASVSAAAKGKGRAAAPDTGADARIAKVESFLQKPDGVTRWRTWLRALLEDMFVIDAATLYCQRSRSGKLVALAQLDGATIKRVIDDWGCTPQPYRDAAGAMVYPPAYQQVLKGLPAVNYSARDIIYRPRNVRAHKIYGYSPVQQVLMTVNIALRRQVWQLDYYSEGSVPDALIGVPNSWTPDQIRQFQDYWDTEFAGDLAKRRRAKFVPGDTAAKVHQTKEPEQKNDFDEWLARIICFAFSIPPQWAVKAMNRATADNQSAQSEEEGLQPTKEWVKDLIDAIIAEEFASPDLELHWLDEDDSDARSSEATLEARLKIGAVTLNEVRAHLGLDPYATPAADRPMVLTASGYVPIDANAGGGGEGEDQAVAGADSSRAADPRAAAGPNVELDTDIGRGPGTRTSGVSPIGKTTIRKAAVDDPDHPGWPRGTPGGRGGKFRPKDGESDGAGHGSRGSATDQAKAFALGGKGEKDGRASEQDEPNDGDQLSGPTILAFNTDQQISSDALPPIPVVDFSGGFHEVVVNAWMEYFQKKGIPAVKEPAIRLIGQTAVVGFPDIMVVLPGVGLATLEIKTGEDPPLTDNQTIYIPMLQLGGHLYSVDGRILALGLAAGVPFPPMPVYVLFAKPGQEYRAIELPAKRPKP